MAYRELELTLLSAQDLKNVNLFTRMDVYAVASISGDPVTRQYTPTDTTGGRNPSWNATMRFSVPPSATSATASGGGWLHVLLRSQRALGDRDVGEVVIPLAELLAGADATGPQPPKLTSYRVHTVLRGEPRGVLNVSYRLGPVVAPVADMNDDDAAAVGYTAQQQPFIKPQNTVAPPHQQYQAHHPQHNADAYAPAPFKQPQKPAAAAQQSYYDSYRYPDAYYKPQQSFKKPQTPQQQPYQYHDHTPSQSFKPQNPPPPWHEEALSPAQGNSNNGHVPTVYNLPGRGKMTSSSVEYLNKSNFNEKLKTGNLVVLEFTAPWSEPCKFMKAKVEKLASEKKDKTVFYALDTREFKELAERLDVEALPTFLLVHKYKLKARVIGVDEDELRNAIDSTNQKISSSS